MIPNVPIKMIIIEDEDAKIYHAIDQGTRLVVNCIHCNEAFAVKWRDENPNMWLIADPHASIGWTYNEDGTFTSPYPPEEEEVTNPS